MSRLLKLNPNFKPSFDGKAIAQNLIDKLIQNNFIIHKAILFGSAAKGLNDINSDLDIVIVIRSFIIF